MTDHLVMGLESGRALAVLREMVGALTLASALPGGSNGSRETVLGAVRMLSPLVASALERHLDLEADVVGASVEASAPENEDDEDESNAHAVACSLHRVMRRVTVRRRWLL